MKQICTIRVPEKERRLSFCPPQWSCVIQDETSLRGYWSLQVLKLKQKMDLPVYQKNWSKFKEYVNKYERIYNTSHYGNRYNIALCQPLSRSYFKLWELIHDFKLLKSENDNSITTAHLAEGPGGFIESVCDYRSTHSTQSCDDRYFGITLLTHKNDDIPNWKKTRQVIHKYPQINIHTGKDNTGNLYNIDNIHAFVDDVGRNSCALVTGDGGIDYSNNYTKQEELSQHLILAQVYTSLLLVQHTKNIVCKLFDTHELFTQEILWVLSVCFDVVHIMKPFTSRAANSERYVIACGFRGCPSYIETYLCELLKNWKETMFLRTIFEKDLPSPFVNALYKYSEWHSKQQFMCIGKCYHLIDVHHLPRIKYSTELTQITKQQEDIAKNWCKKYKIKYRK